MNKGAESTHRISEYNSLSTLTVPRPNSYIRLPSFAGIKSHNYKHFSTEEKFLVKENIQGAVAQKSSGSINRTHTKDTMTENFKSFTVYEEQVTKLKFPKQDL